MKALLRAVPASFTQLIAVFFIGLLPFAASAAIVAVDFAGSISESYDENFDDITGTYFDISGVFFIDTATPEAGTGNYPGAVFGMEVYRDGGLLLTQADFTCGGSCANDMFVSASQEAEAYVQDFFVGNLDLLLAPASGVNFNNDINVFLLAAQGNVADYFDAGSSYGSVQVFGEDYFDLYYLDMTVVPVPAAVWLFGSALAGLGWMRRRRVV